MEQTLGGGRAEEGGHAHPPGRFAEEGDLARIAAERRDVVTHPPERGDLVGKPPVAEARPLLAIQPGLIGLLEHRMGEKAEQAQSVVDGDHHHAALARQPPPSVHASRARPGHERPAVDPDHDRSVAPIHSGGPDVEAQAVLRGGLRLTAHERLDLHRGLVGDRTEPIALADAGPRLHRGGRAPAPPACGRRRVGNAGERPRPVALDPADAAPVHLDHTVHNEDLQSDREPADTAGNLATRPTAPPADRMRPART